MRTSIPFHWINRSAGFAPALVVLAVMLVLVMSVILSAGGDPLALARLGTRYASGDPQGTEGYDGQFVYYIARELHPERAAPYLDVPAYRYQRILLPLLARILAFGRIELITWALVALGVLSQAAGTWLVGGILAGWGVSRWYALVYGLWVGFALAVETDLPEPLAYALVAGALLAGERGKTGVSWVLYGLALFAREVTVAFLIASLLDNLWHRRRRGAVGLLLVSVLPYLVFQLWLWRIFGQLGLASGGEMATSFEIIPFMGLWRIALFSPLYLGAMLLVFGPGAVLPVIWGIWVSVKNLLRGHINVVVLALLGNALLVSSLPFSTFRETGGLLRFLCGLVLSVLLFAARYQMVRPLRYTWLWLVMNVFLFKSSGI